MRLSRRILMATAVLAASALDVAPARADFSELYVSRLNGSVGIINTSTQTETVFASGLGATVSALAFDSTGNLYATTQYKTIEKITPAGVSSVFASGFGDQPYGLAFDSAGNLYVSVANFPNSNIIERITPGGAVSIFASGLGGAEGLAFDGAGNLYAAGYGTIYKITSGGVVSSFASTGSGDNGRLQAIDLAFDGAGNLYASVFSNNTIEKFTPEGSLSIFATGASGLDQPYGLAFDGSGNLYTANFANNTIEYFTPGGVGTVFGTGAGDRPDALAFAPTAVPEPASLAMITIGLVGGAVLLRRKR